MDPSVTLFASTWHRGAGKPFGIKQVDRLLHMYVIGKTGVGKTTLLESLLLSDIRAGRGAALIDPHGDFAERMVAAARAAGRNDITIVDIADPALALGYNPIVRVSPGLRPLLAAGVLEALKKLWPDAWGVRMEHILRNCLLALLDQPAADLRDILRLMSDKRYRAQVVANIENEQVREFWECEFPRYSTRFAADAVAPIQNKVGAFLADPRLRQFFTRKDGAIRLRKIMDEGGLLVVNLAKGRLGEDSANLLGGLLISALSLAAYSRANIPEHERRPFFIYLDEFQNVTTLATANMLSELRKFGVGMVMAHQYLAQLEQDVRNAVLGNAGTQIVFRTGADDAAYFSREFASFEAIDFLSLPNHHFYIRLMIDGAPSSAFSAKTDGKAAPGAP
jgi:type IV secretory pathway TraG/TraD family ATPase VirD4